MDMLFFIISLRLLPLADVEVVVVVVPAVDDLELLRRSLPAISRLSRSCCFSASRRLRLLRLPMLLTL